MAGKFMPPAERMIDNPLTDSYTFIRIRYFSTDNNKEE